MSTAKFGWIISTAARVKDDETARGLDSRLISLTDRFDETDLDSAKEMAIQKFVELNRAWIDTASVAVTYTRPAPERRRTGRYV